MRRRVAALAAVLVSVGVVAACSGGDDASPGTTESPFGPTACPPAEPLLLVDQIDEAIAAVEAELGGPQQFFEINANIAFVNVIVADATSETAVRYRFTPGGADLEVEDLGAAEGFTFSAEDVLLDETRVLSCVADQLSESRMDLIEIVATPTASAQYSVFVTSVQGGQLVVSVNEEGQVLGVETL